MSSPFQFSAAKNYFLGFATSAAFLLAGIFYFDYGKKNKSEVDPTEKIEFANLEITDLQEFDPNNLDENGWKKLGFSEKQVATILKYKNIVGGEFTSKAQLKKCYSISEEKYNELEPYILLPENTKNSYESGKYRSFHNSNPRSFEKKELKIPGKFNPDHFSTADFVKMGLTEKQAHSILKYKQYLGGSFLSKEKFKDCFIISEENFRKMEPYLLLPEKTPENYIAKTHYKSNSTDKEKFSYEKFDPNITDLEGWQKLGFSEKQAQVIVNYRDRNLKGSFKNLDEIARCFVISEEKFEELKPYIVLNPDNLKTNASQKTGNASFVSNSKSESAPEAKTDFAKTDLNQITFKQLLEFGFDEKSAGMILNYRKKLGGFVSRQQIVDTYDIDKELAQKLVAVARLDHSKVPKYTLVSAPEEWLKTHPYFKYSADKIIYYRISYPDDKKIWKFLKTKTEYEARMRLYLID